MSFSVSMLLQIVRTLGVVLTEVGKLKAALPAEEAVTRGPDVVELERQRVAQLQAALELEQSEEKQPQRAMPTDADLEQLERTKRGRLDIGGTEEEGYEP
jgi:hypothetical protein